MAFIERSIYVFALLLGHLYIAQAVTTGCHLNITLNKHGLFTVLDKLLIKSSYKWNSWQQKTCEVLLQAPEGMGIHIDAVLYKSSLNSSDNSLLWVSQMTEGCFFSNFKVFSSISKTKNHLLQWFSTEFLSELATDGLPKLPSIYAGQEYLLVQTEDYGEVTSSQGAQTMCVRARAIPESDIRDSACHFADFLYAKDVWLGGTIRSPGFPKSYYFNLSCRWKLVTAKAMRLNFTHFNLPSLTPPCTPPYMTIGVYHRRSRGFVPHLSDSFVQRFNSSHTVASVRQPFGFVNDTMVIYFHSGNCMYEGDLSEHGFQITFEVVDLTEKGCSSPFNVDWTPGEIQLPLSSLGAVTCSWKLTPVGTDKLIVIETLGALDNSCASRPSLVVYNGPNHNMPVLFDVYFTRRYNIYNTSKSSVFIEFKAESLHQCPPDFLLFFYKFVSIDEIACSDDNRPVILASPTIGSVASPGFDSNLPYPSNANCSWLISAPRGHIVRSTFTEFTVEGCPDCHCDAINVYGGYPKHGARRISTLCGNQGRLIISSGSSQMFLEFTSDSVREYKGFLINYEATHLATLACNAYRQPAHLWSDGEVLSMGYESREFYSPNSHCTWRLGAPEGQVIVLKLVEYDIPSNNQCTEDRLVAHDGQSEESNVLKTWCGQGSHSADVLSTGRFVFIVFNSDEAREGRGFELSFHFQDETFASKTLTIVVSMVAVLLVFVFIGLVWSLIRKRCWQKFCSGRSSDLMLQPQVAEDLSTNEGCPIPAYDEAPPPHYTSRHTLAPPSIINNQLYYAIADTPPPLADRPPPPYSERAEQVSISDEPSSNHEERNAWSSRPDPFLQSAMNNAEVVDPADLWQGILLADGPSCSQGQEALMASDPSTAHKRINRKRKAPKRSLDSSPESEIREDESRAVSGIYNQPSSTTVSNTQANTATVDKQSGKNEDSSHCETTV